MPDPDPHQNAKTLKKRKGRSPEFHVDFLCEWENRRFPWVSRFSPLATALLLEEHSPGNVNVILCQDDTVRALNRDYRKLDKVTDVLSFEWHEPTLLGEIYIARDQVKRQAPLYGNSYYAELKRVIVHGILHLCGYDHMRPADRAVMRRREQEVLGLDLYGNGDDDE